MKGAWSNRSYPDSGCRGGLGREHSRAYPKGHKRPLLRQPGDNVLAASPTRQRGAALVVAAVFLVAIMVVLGDVTLRLSATDVTDSALQADAVDALFLAETGMEYAAQRLANGITCANLVMSSAVSFGRGDFQVTQATDVSGDCRIRVTGRVLFSGTNLRAQRTVEGLLSASGVGAIAVGNNGTILHWDGSSWSSVASGTSGDLNGIDCPDQNNCMAVASNDHYTIWDGSNWNVSTNGLIRYTDVDCRSGIDDCHATGTFFFPRIVHWDGSNWGLSHTSTVGGFFNSLFEEYSTITCSSVTCHAGSSNSVLSRLSGVWSNEVDNIGTPINGITCPTDNDCWAVGNAINGGPNRGYAIYGRNAGGWFTAILSANPTRDLYGVDCLTVSDCWAVGERRNGNTFTVVRRSGGSWVLANQGLGAAEDLFGIDCNDTGRCWAVGNNGVTLHYDGSSWSVIATPTTETLNDVHYLDGSGGGGVSLARWWEIIN